MSSADHAYIVDEVARDLDLLIFRMERSERAESDDAGEVRKTRRELEGLRDRLLDLAMRLES